MPTSPTPEQGSALLPIVIVGGGVAALEAILALRADAGDDLPIEFICPNDRFSYRPLSVLEPFSDVAPLTVELDRFAEEQRVALRRDFITRVRPTEHAVETDSGEAIGYRALLVAVGAQASPALRA